MLSMNFHCMPLLLVFTVLLVATFGCGNKDPRNRQSVSGSVSLDGTPLDKGSVEFSSQGQGGTSSGALIKKGQYAIETSKGLPPGKYIVRLFSTSNSSSPGQVPAGPPGPPPARSSAGQAKQLIPPQYNVRSTQVVEVVGDGPNVFDFDVRTK